MKNVNIIDSWNSLVACSLFLYSQIKDDCQERLIKNEIVPTSMKQEF